MTVADCFNSTNDANAATAVANAQMSSAAHARALAAHKLASQNWQALNNPAAYGPIVAVHAVAVATHATIATTLAAAGK